MKILVTDVHTRKGFDTVSILRQHYPKAVLVLAAPKDTGFQLPVVYGQKVYAFDKSSAENFKRSFTAIVAAQGSAVVYMPVEEDTTLLVYGLLKDAPPAALVHALPPFESFVIARDKEASAAFADNLGLPVPRRFGKESLPALHEVFVPLVAKPKQGTGSAGLHFIESPEQMSILNELDLDRYIVQEKIAQSHAVEGGFFLFRHGKPAGYYGHQRIRTYPVKGGVTVYSRLAFNPEIEAAGNALLAGLKWHGVAMVEYLHDPTDGQYKLIEINPRLWGSILLSEKGETQFLPNYVRTALGEELLPQGRPHNERFIRWLFPFDLLNKLRNPGAVPRFWRMNRESTCYIGFTYASWLRALSFLVYQTLNFSSVRKFFKKLRG